ncbi:PLP-dependent aminotransferase family protein [Rhizobium sp. CFBP 8762]|uniref:aminotransferase-like domain-containing protein n=1 Tax=Rhizobium sp. CFBP 8762 TaxID=2775279 RepID=UPI001780DB61|nr:PLP-dependent aminotransferase family protein [Rhizobium sp. CFBP 8762]MBD8554762.1 PLP-dependent aminotransferase family protein [Rhizobium sp. CFBP 8762]
MLDWQAVYATRASRMKASEIRELLKLLDQPDIISFAGGIPDPALFPKEAFRAAYTDVLTGSTANAALQYSVSEGYLPLREWLVEQMGAIGIACRPENIMIVSGSQQGLDYLGKLFLSPGDTALVTRPTYLGALQAFNAYEPNYDQLAINGNRTPQSYADNAASNGGRAKFAYVTADFGNPSGETMTLAERERLLDLATELDMPVLEDGAYQSLRYDGEAIPPILALDLARNGGEIDATRTIYSGSFSKTLAPGLRTGWLCASEAVISKLVLMKQAADLHSSTINQMAIHHVATHGFAAQVEKIRVAYRERRDLLLSALARHMPAGVEWTKPEGGMFIWVTLPESIDSAALLAEAVKTVRIAFVPGQAFHADGTGANTLRLSFSCASAQGIEEGMLRLGNLIRKTLGT